MSDQLSPIPTLRLLAVMEPKTVTGAAKNMLDFYQAAKSSLATPHGVNVELSIVTFERDQSISESRSNQFVESAQQMGVEVDLIPEGHKFDLRVIPSLRRIVRRRAPEIVITHHVKSHFVMRASNLWKEIPWVAYHHGYTQTQKRELFYNRLDRWSLRKARLVITVCEAFARDLEKFAAVPRQRIHVQHNSIASQEIVGSAERANLRNKIGIQPQEKLILAVGRLSAEKAHIDLLRAFSGIADPQMEIKLVIIGDGPERAKLEATAEALSIRERVIFTGQIKEVRPYYVAADVFVLPSHSEGSPYVLLEAMAANLPIVATEVGGVGEMVTNNKTALLVPAREPRALGEAITRILTDNNLGVELANNARELIATRFSPDTTFKALVNVYRRLLTN